MSDSANVQAKKVGFFRRRADGKGMPFEEGDVGNIYVDVVPRLEAKMRWFSDDKADHFTRQDNTHRHPGFSFVSEAFDKAHPLLN